MHIFLDISREVEVNYITDIGHIYTPKFKTLILAVIQFEKVIKHLFPSGF